MILIGTMVSIGIICIILFLNGKEDNKNNDVNRADLFIKEENDIKYTALPTASPELISQIEEAPKEIVKPRIDTADPYFCTLEYQIKHTIGCRVDELEFTDIPVGKSFEYEGLEFTITDYSIITGKEFMDQFFDEEDKKIPESVLSKDYAFTKDGTYAVVYYSFKKIMDEATYIELEMLFTDMKVYGVYDRNLTEMVKKYLGKTGMRRLMDIPKGEQIDAVMVLNLENQSDSDVFFIMIPKVSGESETSKVISGEMTQEEASAIYQKYKNKFYRIKLDK